MMRINTSDGGGNVGEVSNNGEVLFSSVIVCLKHFVNCFKAMKKSICICILQKRNNPTGNCMGEHVHVRTWIEQQPYALHIKRGKPLILGELKSCCAAQS